jgi:hypothetical protein
VSAEPPSHATVVELAQPAPPACALACAPPAAEAPPVFSAACGPAEEAEEAEEAKEEAEAVTILGLSSSPPAGSTVF